MNEFKTRLSVDCFRCGKPVYFNELRFQQKKTAYAASGVRLQFALRICEFDKKGEVVCDRYEGEDAGLSGSFPLCEDCMSMIESWLFEGEKLKCLEEEYR